jgi:hypothetical protein
MRTITKSAGHPFELFDLAVDRLSQGVGDAMTRIFNDVVYTFSSTSESICLTPFQGSLSALAAHEYRSPSGRRSNVDTLRRFLYNNLIHKPRQLDSQYLHKKRFLVHKHRIFQPLYINI